MKPFAGPHSTHYPYIVIRWMSCAYDVRCVDYTDGPSVVGGDRPRIEVHVPRGADEHARRRAVIEVCHDLVEKIGRRCCAVFAKNDSVFCEEGRTERDSAERPSGGVDVGSFATDPLPPEGDPQ